MVDVNADVLQAIEELRTELRTVSERLARIEASGAKTKLAPVVVEPAIVKSPEPARAPDLPIEAISEEILLVISAAVAAFLGERAHIRQVRLISSGGWALQGRVFIQASHSLSR